MPSEEQTYRAHLLETLERIETQTTKTNGRVSSLERWQSYVLGAVALLTLLVLPVLLAGAINLL